MEVTTIFDSDRAEYEYMQEQDVEKAIEEIATIIAGTERVALDVVGAPPSSNMLAKAVYFAGYRKQIEGEWIADFDQDYYCSKCGSYPKSYVENHECPPFCPNCGAKMKGGAE